MVHDQSDEASKCREDAEEFISIVAHDLRSPMLTISGYCEVLQEDCANELGEDGRQYIERIVGATGQIQRLLEDLLDYSRIGRLDAPSEPVDLNEALARAKEDSKEEIDRNGATVIAENLPEIFGCRKRLVQLFEKLLDNALKFRREDAPRVCISATRDGRSWTVRVADNGIGIKQEHLGQIFTMCSQLNGRKYAGTGIGLAACEKIVRTHGGRIRAQSQPDQGTTVLFTLPAG